MAALVPVLVTGIQSTPSVRRKDSFQPKDLGGLDSCHKHRNEGVDAADTIRCLHFGASNHTTVFKTPFFQGKFPSISEWIDLRNADTLRAGQPATAMTFL